MGAGVRVEGRGAQQLATGREHDALENAGLALALEPSWREPWILAARVHGTADVTRRR